MSQKAIVTTINYAGIKFEGLMLPNGSFGIANIQLSSENMKLLAASNKQVTKTIKSILGKDYTASKTYSEISKMPVSYLELDIFSKLLMLEAFKGNMMAQKLLIASTTEKLERVFNDAFGVVVEEREYEQRFAARLMTKTTFKPLTDELKKQGYTEGWQYGKYMHQFQEILGFKDGTRDKLPLATLLELGNCQSELKILMRSGYDPEEALAVWKENR